MLSDAAKAAILPKPAAIWARADDTGRIVELRLSEFENSTRLTGDDVSRAINKGARLEVVAGVARVVLP